MKAANPKVSLEQALLEAHEADDFVALVDLYSQAADDCETSEDREAACFYLTHAYIFALAHGLDAAVALRSRLVGYGRES
jgi:hypothetical protein